MALVVAQAKKIYGGGANPITFAAAWTPTAASLLVCHVFAYGGDSANHSVSGSVSGAFTAVAAARHDYSSLHLSVHYRLNCPGGLEDLTVTPGDSTTYTVAIFHEVAGAHLTTPFTAGEVANADYDGSGTNPQTGSFSNSIADSIFFAGLANENGDNPATLTVNQTGSTPTTPNQWALRDSAESQETNGSARTTASVPYIIVTSSAPGRHGWTTAEALATTNLIAFRQAVVTQAPLEVNVSPTNATYLKTAPRVVS